jgi:hypothetical protein
VTSFELQWKEVGLTELTNKLLFLPSLSAVPSQEVLTSGEQLAVLLGFR